MPELISWHHWRQNYCVRHTNTDTTTRKQQEIHTQNKRHTQHASAVPASELIVALVKQYLQTKCHGRTGNFRHALRPHGVTDWQADWQRDVTRVTRRRWRASIIDRACDRIDRLVTSLLIGIVVKYVGTWLESTPINSIFYCPVLTVIKYLYWRLYNYSFFLNFWWMLTKQFHNLKSFCP